MPPKDKGIYVEGYSQGSVSDLESAVSDAAGFYTPACFENGYPTRRVLDFDLSDKAAADRAEIDAMVAAGASREAAMAPYLTDAAFDTWYNAFCARLESKAHP